MLQPTYATLETVLAGLGFAFNGIYENYKVFQHDTGALAFYPESPLDSPVLPYHMLLAGLVLQTCGIAEPPELADRLQKSS